MEHIIESIVKGMQTIITNDYLSVFIISMIPMIEVRGAIPIAIGMGIAPFSAFLFSTLSALVICPILIFCLKPILNWLKTTKFFKKIGHAVEDLFMDKAKNIDNKADSKSSLISDEETAKSERKKLFYKILGLFCFVAIPLPMTGVWTGSAVAVFMNLKLKYSLPTIAIGNFFAGFLITLMTILLKDKAYIIIYVLIVFVVITLASLMITLFIKKNKKTAQKEKI